MLTQRPRTIATAMTASLLALGALAVTTASPAAAAVTGRYAELRQDNNPSNAAIELEARCYITSTGTYVGVTARVEAFMLAPGSVRNYSWVQLDDTSVSGRPVVAGEAFDESRSPNPAGVQRIRAACTGGEFGQPTSTWYSPEQSL